MTIVDSVSSSLPSLLLSSSSSSSLSSLSSSSSSSSQISQEQSGKTCIIGSKSHFPSSRYKTQLSLESSLDTTAKEQHVGVTKQPSQLLTSYVPFPNSSVNLITCSSNSGKTHFLKQIVENRHTCFSAAHEIRRIVYVNGNQRDLSIEHPWVDSNLNLEIVSLSLDELCNTSKNTNHYSEQDYSHLSCVLAARDLLILDDILRLNDDIQFILKYGAHHYNLSAVFIVTQSCLSSPLYSLVSTVHNIILLFGNTATTRLAQHLFQTFFLCQETKQYFKAICSLAERAHDIVILKLNSIASCRIHSRILAITKVQHLFVAAAAAAAAPHTTPYCFVYPELNYIDWFSQQTQSVYANMSLEEGAFLKDAFVLLPASQVKSVPPSSQLNDESNSDNRLCAESKEQKWNDMALFLEKEIESTFPIKKWNAAKNLTREILRCKDLCISADYRTLFLNGKPSTAKNSFSIIDFITAATRKAGPGETIDNVAHYKPLITILLKNNVPQAFFVNKLMLSPAHQRHVGRHVMDDDDDDDNAHNRESRAWSRQFNRRRHRSNRRGHRDSSRYSVY